jgi:hypothetical protein
MAAGFAEFVAADGLRIRHMEAGRGQGAWAQAHPAHELLSRKRRVVAFEMPGSGTSAVNARTHDTAELARTALRIFGKFGSIFVQLMILHKIYRVVGGETGRWRLI